MTNTPLRPSLSVDTSSITYSTQTDPLFFARNPADKAPSYAVRSFGSSNSQPAVATATEMLSRAEILLEQIRKDMLSQDTRVEWRGPVEAFLRDVKSRRGTPVPPEAAADEVKALREVYDAAKRVLRFDGVDRGRSSSSLGDLAAAAERVRLAVHKEGK